MTTVQLIEDKLSISTTNRLRYFEDGLSNMSMRVGINKLRLTQKPENSTLLSTRH